MVYKVKFLMWQINRFIDDTMPISSGGFSRRRKKRSPHTLRTWGPQNPFELVEWNFLLVKMSGMKRERNVLNVEQKLGIFQKLDNGKSAGSDAEDVLNEGNTISHSAALQSVENVLDYMGQRGF
ncbi:hypothetical protein AVEN_141734-1 [Araneus ventricosus]|uniref:Uncharacterized protein n=1 Tax=Araneus ventricosus TaxID=182803 RepID=A0A4Y2ICN2_ARAVE|nr:hypothetical protein AVEN_141734-1 [Araneus ventricosus]